MHSGKCPNPDRSPESLQTRLRALPQPPVPADLEARLLATIPVEMPIPRRRRAVWIGVVSALAAACLLAVLARLGRESKHPIPNPGTNESAHAPDTDHAPHAGLPTPPTPPVLGAGLPTPPTSDFVNRAAWLDARRILDGAEPATFTWPLEETSPLRVSTSIPPDLLD
jgi:hypothetical protein